MSKKLIVLAVALIVFTSCEGLNDSYVNSRLAKKVQGQSIYYTEFPGINEVGDITYWVRDTIEYRLDNDSNTDFNYTIKELLDRKFGDCDANALIVADILYVRFGIKVAFGFVDGNDNSLPSLGVAYGTKEYDKHFSTHTYSNPAKVSSSQASGRAIVGGGVPNHVVLIFPDGAVIEPRSFFPSNDALLYTFEFDQVFTAPATFAEGYHAPPVVAQVSN